MPQLYNCYKLLWISTDILMFIVCLCIFYEVAINTNALVQIFNLVCHWNSSHSGGGFRAPSPSFDSCNLYKIPKFLKLYYTSNILMLMV